MTREDMERRLLELETALAHQQAEIQDLSDVIAGQWQTIDRLTGRLDRAETLIRQVFTERQDHDGETAPE